MGNILAILISVVVLWIIFTIPPVKTARDMILERDLDFPDYLM